MSFWEIYHNPKRSDPKMKIDQFSLMQLLGNGSYGRVVLAQQKRTKQTYAIKILNIQKIIKKHQVEHTNNEKRIMFACDHANIIRIHACFKDSINLYYLLDVYPAGDFYTLLNAHTYFDENHAKFYAANVYLAFEYLHENNVVYRDLKPENLLVSNTGYLVLTDFGFAKCLSEANCARTYSICGTGDYFSPE
jgi:protein kinase A